MPCNGHNHPPECNCGWGGTYYASSGHYFYGYGYWAREASHTNPNAHCPVCGASVFFYRSPHDGRVFFDSLGPPWPKHPCTSDEARGETRTAAGERRDGWIPFLCDTVQPLPGGKGTLLRDVQGRELFTKSKSSSFSLEAPIWIRRADSTGGRYLISTLKTKSGRTYEFKSDGYRNPEQWARSVRQNLEDDKRLPLDRQARTGVAERPAPALRRELPAVIPAAHKPTLHLNPKLPKSAYSQPKAPPVTPPVKQATVGRPTPKAPPPIRTARARPPKDATGKNSRTAPQRTPTAIELAFSRAANKEGGLDALTKLLGN